MKASAMLLLALMSAVAAGVAADKGHKSARKEASKRGPALRCSSSSDCSATECCIRKGKKSFCKPLEKLRKKCSTVSLDEQFIKYCPCAADMTCAAKTEQKQKKYGICQPATNGTAATATSGSRRKGECLSSAECGALECCVHNRGRRSVGVCRRRSHRQRYCEDQDPTASVVVAGLY